MQFGKLKPTRRLQSMRFLRSCRPGWMQLRGCERHSKRSRRTEKVEHLSCLKCEAGQDAGSSGGEVCANDLERPRVQPTHSHRFNPWLPGNWTKSKAVTLVELRATRAAIISRSPASSRVTRDPEDRGSPAS